MREFWKIVLLSNVLILHVLSFKYLGNKGFILQCKVDWKFMACKDELNDTCMYMPKTIIWILQFNVLFKNKNIHAYPTSYFSLIWIELWLNEPFLMNCK